MARALRANGTSRRKAAWPDHKQGSSAHRREANDIPKSRGTRDAGATPVTGELASTTNNSTTAELVTREYSAAFEAERVQSRAQMLQGRIEVIGPRQIEGWAWDPQAPDRRIRLELVEGSIRLSAIIADHYRQDLVELGCGDGRHGFSIELQEGLLSGGHRPLILRCADTGAAMPGSPIVAKRGGAANGQMHNPEVLGDDTTTQLAEEPVRWHAEVDTSTGPSPTPDNQLVADVAFLSQPTATASSATLWSTVRKLSAGSRIRHTVRRSDLTRYRLVQRFVAKDAAMSVLSVTDIVRRTSTLPSKFFTNSMIAVWLSRGDLQQRFQQLDKDACQYAFLAWYLCVRPIEEGLALSSEPTDPILTAMSKVIVAKEPEASTGCTALMLAAYCYASNYDGRTMLAPAQCQAKDIVAWFVCEGAHQLGVSRAIPQDIRIDLATPRSEGLAPILQWAADRMPALNSAELTREGSPETILEWLNVHDPERARCWQEVSLRESLIIDSRAPFDDPPKPVLPAVCRRLRDVVRDMADFLLDDGQAEHMCIGGNGERLLLKDEWYPVEAAFTWSRTPISTVLFCAAEGTIDWLRIGLTFDRAPLPDRGVTITLNHNRLWSGTISDASRSELILACTGQCLTRDAPICCRSGSTRLLCRLSSRYHQTIGGSE